MTPNNDDGIWVRAHYRLAADGRLVADQIHIEGPALQAAILKKLPLAQLEAVANTPTRCRSHDEPLRRPGRHADAEFHQHVAARYQTLAACTRAAAAELAAEANVPVATAHRWIAAARRLGYLPPARQGRAG